MTKLKSIIYDLSDADYDLLEAALVKSPQSKALLSLIRQKKTSEEIAQKLNLTKSAFYTLSSRLVDQMKKIQIAGIGNEGVDSKSILNNLPYLIYNSPREKVKAMLDVIEKDFIEKDKFNELIILYPYLQKVYANTDRYNHYVERYNYYLNKSNTSSRSDRLVLEINKLTADFFLSRDLGIIEIVNTIRNELNSLAKKNNSNHVNFNKAIADISWKVFFDFDKSDKTSINVSDSLEFIRAKIYKKNVSQEYSYLLKLYYYLSFEYYNKVGRYAEAKGYFNIIDKDFSSLLLIDHCCLPTRFLISKLKYCQANGTALLLHGNNDLISELVKFSPTDFHNYFCFYKYLAVSAFLLKDYNAAIFHLNILIETTLLKKFPFSRHETYILLSICKCFSGEVESAMQIIEKLKLNLNKSDGKEFNSLKNLTKVFYGIYNINKANCIKAIKKVKTLRDKFATENSGEGEVFEWLDISDKFISDLSIIIMSKEVSLSHNKTLNV